jgi:hypothetical protein
MESDPFHAIAAYSYARQSTSVTGISYNPLLQLIQATLRLFSSQNLDISFRQIIKALDYQIREWQHDRSMPASGSRRRSL